MKKIIFILLGILPIAALSFSEETKANNADAEKVHAIIERYAQACGCTGMAEIRSEIRKGTLVRQANGKVPLQIFSKAPDQWRYDQTFAWGDQVSYGFDGTRAWMADTKGFYPMDPRQRLDLQMLFDVHAPLKMYDFFSSMKMKGEEVIAGRTADTLAAVSTEGFQTELAFDRETGLLLRAGRIYFEDYREVGPFRRPFKIVFGTEESEDPYPMVMVFEEIQPDPEIEDSLFRQPQCFLPFLESPLYKRPPQVEVDCAAMDACTGVYRLVSNP
ncbi:MAG: hypothetical protein KJ645_04465, partial [Planctomycetes bacterium]|nr:hypothetical protein [Planctomycetota bacterium]